MRHLCIDRRPGRACKVDDLGVWGRRSQYWVGHRGWSRCRCTDSSGLSKTRLTSGLPHKFDTVSNERHWRPSKVVDRHVDDLDPIVPVIQLLSVCRSCVSLLMASFLPARVQHASLVMAKRRLTTRIKLG